VGFQEIAASPDIYDILTNSIAPNIFELDDVKRGILCLLFGGANKDFSAAGTGRFRGEINALLCGDPGTSKSQLLQYVHKIAPRGIYTSGKGSSAVGLTAYVTRDVDTNEMVLESGALVLSDRGVCCIDEFDKMSDAARSILHEVMEQQTVSIAKAGIICTLNARTSILASANPKESRYNPRLSVVENIQLPPTLMSRFDLIYLILDKPNEQMDRRLAMHIVNLYSPNPQKPARPVLSKAELTAYITHAKKHCSPRLSEEAGDVLVNQYVQLRQLGQIGNRKVITATPRQLESMVRLSEALAKMHLSDIVSADDVHEAARLMAVATQQAATDPRTGLIDMDTITTGHSASERRLMDEGLTALKEFFKNRGSGGAFKDLFPEFTQVFTAMRVTELDFKKMLLHLEREENFLVFNTTGAGSVPNPMIRLQRTGALNERDDGDADRV
jgi:DNA replication licensing factor MCM4